MHPSHVSRRLCSTTAGLLVLGSAFAVLDAGHTIAVPDVGSVQTKAEIARVGRVRISHSRKRRGCHLHPDVFSPCTGCKYRRRRISAAREFVVAFVLECSWFTLHACIPNVPVSP
ncbi:hypothetical protein PLICRDRAFT_311062 [Plicaturopsis crispa FD-325 SS-3]|nr:hypothetical protein PLICRDRAFT_311062 [Plicaturopsis crispa FD-325 SS-3]